MQHRLVVHRHLMMGERRMVGSMGRNHLMMRNSCWSVMIRINMIVVHGLVFIRVILIMEGIKVFSRHGIHSTHSVMVKIKISRALSNAAGIGLIRWHHLGKFEIRAQFMSIMLTLEMTAVLLFEYVIVLFFAGAFSLISWLSHGRYNFSWDVMLTMMEKLRCIGLHLENETTVVDV